MRYFCIVSCIDELHEFRDMPSVYGPSTCTRPVCLECLRPVIPDTTGRAFRCPACRFPMCGEECRRGAVHARECAILSRCANVVERTDLDKEDRVTYSAVFILR